MNKILMAIIATVVMVIVVLAAFVFLGGEDDPETMNFNGTDFTWEQLEDEFGTRTIGANTGVSLSAIMNSTAFADLESDDQNKTLFRITADDGWTKNVSWMDLQSGILMEDDMMTFFPNLPSSFKVKNVASIDDVPLGPLMIIKVGGSMRDNSELTWAGISAALDEVTVSISGQDTQAMKMADVFALASFTGLENATFTFEGVDGYSKSVNYTEVQNGYLVEDGQKTYFVNLSGSYRVKNLVRIWVEY